MKIIKHLNYLLKNNISSTLVKSDNLRARHDGLRAIYNVLSANRYNFAFQ